MVDSLILLVGHNPMPNYIVADKLKPSRIYWLFTSETSGEHQRLDAVLKAQYPALHTVPLYLSDATSPPEIARALAQVPEGAWLNYTGGTKVMTVQSHKYWTTRLGGNSERASYFDGYRGLLRFDDGTDVPVGSVSLNIDRVLSLHGLGRDRGMGVPEGAGIVEADKNLILKAVLQNPARCSQLYQACRTLRSDPQVAESPISLGFLPDDCKPEFTKRPHWPCGVVNRIKRAWGRFLTGGWFEDWTEATVTAACQVGNLEVQIAAGVRPTTPHQTEVDLLVLRGYRVYLISCIATSCDSDLVKMKCYEARNRVELVGGDLTKAAVVCLLPEHKAQEVEAKVRVPWQPSLTGVKVFNIGHIRNWHERNDYSSLINWLSE